MVHSIAGAYLVLLGTAFALYTWAGFTLRLPVFLAVQVLVVAAPVGFGLVELGRLVGRVRDTRLQCIVGIAAGFVLLAVWRQGGAFPIIVVAVLAGLIVRLAIRPSEGVVWLSAVVALIAWLTSVQLLNYVILKAAVARLADPVVWSIDMKLYQTLLGRGDLSGLFPVVRSPFPMLVLENAYLTLVAQPMAIILLTLTDQPRLARFLLTGLTCHLSAMAFFLVFPTVGPTLYYPELFDASFGSSMTGQAIAAMLIDLCAVRDGMQPVTGFGYFVALPSLHAALATACQLASRGQPLYWILFPLNVVLVCSTFLLGQHYIVDALAGIVLGWAVWVWWGHVAGVVAGYTRRLR